MKEAVRHTAEVMTSTKAGLSGVFIANLSAWWMDWGSELVTAFTGIAGLVYIILMSMLKWQEYKLKKRENDFAEK